MHDIMEPVTNGLTGVVVLVSSDDSVKSTASLYLEFKRRLPGAAPKGSFSQVY